MLLYTREISCRRWYCTINWKREDWRGALRRMGQTLDDRWSPAFITHRLHHRGEWSLSLRWSVGQLPDPRAFPRNKRARPSVFAIDIVIRIVTVVYIYTYVYLHACMCIIVAGNPFLQPFGVHAFDESVAAVIVRAAIAPNCNGSCCDGERRQ